MTDMTDEEAIAERGRDGVSYWMIKPMGLIADELCAIHNRKVAEEYKAGVLSALSDEDRDGILDNFDKLEEWFFDYVECIGERRDLPLIWYQLANEALTDD